jgi:hypothetical protein
MKTILAVAAVLSFGTVYAQTTDGSGDESLFNIAPQEEQAEEGQRHMVEFNAESIPSLIYSIERSKAKGTSGDTESGSNISLNYAYAIHPNVQVGGKFNFFNGVFANNDVERMDVQASGWFNTKAGDLANSPYVSVSLGTGYAQTFGSNGGRDDLWLGSLSFGKRFGLDRIGVKHISWTPELAFVTENSTNDSSYDYRQATEFRLLQFSVLW